MKFFKYLLYTILALVVIFFAVGLFTSTISYGHEIQVNKPVSEAWAVSQDESKYDQWLQGFKSMELIEGEKFAPGSKYKIIVTPGEGQPDFEMIETLVSIEENDHVSMSFDNVAMICDQKYTFSENDGVTTVTTDSKVMGKGIVNRSLFALMEMLGGAFTKQETKNIEALKVLIEENTTDYYPEPIEMDSIAAPLEAEAEG